MQNFKKKRFTVESAHNQLSSMAEPAEREAVVAAAEPAAAEAGMPKLKVLTNAFVVQEGARRVLLGMKKRGFGQMRIEF